MFAIYLTIALDFLGVGIVIPILAPLLLGADSLFLPTNYSINQKTLILGLLLAVYPLCGFFGAPILGMLSDRWGRKKILLITLKVAFLSYLIFGIGIVTANIFLLFLGRILGGLAGGNVPIAISALADKSQSNEKAANFGLIGVLSFGFGGILGPFLGGLLSDSNRIAWFGFSTPFWFAAALVFVNLILVWLFFKETLKDRVKTKFHLLLGAKNILQTFMNPKIRAIFIISFLVTFCFNIFAQFFPVYLFQKFSLTTPQIGDLFAYFGIWMVFSQGVLTRVLARKNISLYVLFSCLPFLFLSFLLILLPIQVSYLYLVLPVLALFQGLVWPFAAAIISNSVPGHMQGEVLGINQSLIYLAQGIPPLIAVLVATITVELPIILASLVAFLAWMIFLGYVKFQPQKIQRPQ